MTAKTRYLVLLRGINVGGKHRVPMPKLKALLEEIGFEDVSTYIQSGNAIVTSGLAASSVARKIEKGLSESFKLDSEIIKVLAVPLNKVRAVVNERPKGFGDEPDKYHSDVIFLMDLTPAEALTAFSPREGVDALWSANGVIYHQRLSALRTKAASTA
jgi:uncharacterized protein (DUF1697 family)